jgi:glutathione S-transferase
MIAPIELIQFERSHYNDKARWALDYKAIPHSRTCLLPGLHFGAVAKLTGGTTVPVLRMDGQVVGGSAAIIDALEARQPAPSLYPTDAADRTRALEIQALFDDEAGPAVRAALFAAFIKTAGYFSTVFSTHASTPKRLMYRAIYPVARRKLVTEMHLEDPEVLRRNLDRTEKAFDFVAENAGPTGYLVGDRFSVADLAAAALLAPAVETGRHEMVLPEPRPPAVVAWHRRWADHPGAAWVRARYANDRPASSSQ